MILSIKRSLVDRFGGWQAAKPGRLIEHFMLPDEVSDVESSHGAIVEMGAYAGRRSNPTPGGTPLPTRRRVAAGSIGVLLALSLAGCDVNVHGPGPVSVSQEGGQLLIAVCRTMVVTEIVGEHRAEDGAWSEFLSATGEWTFERGDVLDSRSLPDPLEETSEPPELQGGELAIALAGISPDKNVLGTFQLEQPLADQGWLQVDGSTTEEPCPK